MQPRESIRLHTVYLEQLKEWLSNAEGPDLIERTKATKQDSLLGMAVSFDPLHYYPPVGVDAVVGMGLVFKPAYIPTVSFSSLLTTLMDWSVNPKERLSEACLTFLNISPESEVYPLCRNYPVLVDLTSKELVSSHFMRSRVMNFWAFKLPFVCGLSPKSNEWARYVSIPCLAGTASYLLTQHTRKEGSLRRGLGVPPPYVSVFLLPTRATGPIMQTRSSPRLSSGWQRSVCRGRRRLKIRRRQR